MTSVSTDLSDYLTARQNKVFWMEQLDVAKQKLEECRENVCRLRQQIHGDGNQEIDKDEMKE